MALVRRFCFCLLAIFLLISPVRAQAVTNYIACPAGGAASAPVNFPLVTNAAVAVMEEVNHCLIPAGDWMVQGVVLICPTMPANVLRGFDDMHINLSDSSGSIMAPPMGGPHAEHVYQVDDKCQYRHTATALWSNSSPRTTYLNVGMTYRGGAATVISWMYAFRLAPYAP